MVNQIIEFFRALFNGEEANLDLVIRIGWLDIACVCIIVGLCFWVF